MHYVLLTIKRFYLNFLYWGPFISGLVTVAILAALIYLLIALSGKVLSGVCFGRRERGGGGGVFFFS